jgi:RimJ/RimL family protein N-acetyltransferase
MLKSNNDIELRGASENEKPRMIGVVGTKVQIEGQEDMEMSYILHCDYWNKGYMTEALGAFAGSQGIFWRLESESILCQYFYRCDVRDLISFTPLDRKNIRRLVAIVDEENVPSMKTIVKIGGRRGEQMIKFYGLGRDQGLDGKVPWEKMRDCISWYLDRHVRP